MEQWSIDVKHDLRAERQARAIEFQRQLSERGTFIVRLLSSPGAGKTTLLEKTAQALAGRYSIGILVGDIETDRDAQRLAPFASTVQLTTGGACHLELPLVQRGLTQLDGGPFDFLFIEDVGNLICPASHNLGEHLRVIVLSTPEGDDKPGKYPKAFRTSQVVVLSKQDLLPYVSFSVARAQADASRVQPQLEFVAVSALTGDGMDAWCEMLKSHRESTLGAARQ